MRKLNIIHIIIALITLFAQAYAADNTIKLNQQVTQKSLSAIAKESIVLLPGFNAKGTNTTFNAKIGNINSIYPTITLAEGSTDNINTPDPTHINGEAKNSVSSYIPLEAINNVNQLNAENSILSIDYMDGIGQLALKIQKNVTPQNNDLALIQNNDFAGNVTKQWMPVPVEPNSSNNPGIILQEIKNYYNDMDPYSTVSPVIRNSEGALEVSYTNTGTYWQNENIALKQYSKTATDADDLSFKQFKAIGDELILEEDFLGWLNAKVIQTLDEEGNSVYQYYDVHDRIILIRRKNFSENHDTYYVYNEFGQLKFILSPKASDLITTPGSYQVAGVNTQNNPLSQLAYIYNYDKKGRCIEKKIPGKDWQKFIYDQADRLAFSQDGLQRESSQWTFYKYDKKERLIQSGTTVFADVNNMQSIYNSQSAVESFVQNSGYTATTTMGENTLVLTQNFYDNYNYLDIQELTNYKNKLQYENRDGYNERYSLLVEGTDISTIGMLTGTVVKLLDGTSPVVTSVYYNEKGQIIQNKANNRLGGWDFDFFKFNYSGLLLSRCHVHQTQFLTTDNTMGEIVEKYSLKYDRVGRLLSVRHKLNNQKEIVMDSLLYDEIGRVVSKKLHGGIQTINYAYNLQNRLKQISSQHFTETLYYEDSPFGNGMHNGLLSATVFGNGSDKRYLYSYDQLNRLTAATNGENNNFAEIINNYDRNSNIEDITRYGYMYDYDRNIVQGPIDLVNMQYNGNQIKSASDNAIQSDVITDNDFRDISLSGVDNEYRHDNNGNRTADLNKGIAWTKYNLLNLPEKVQFSNGTKNQYVYDAIGLKVQADYNYSTLANQVPLGNTEVENTAPANYSIHYCGNYVYEKSGSLPYRLRKILTPEGYVVTFTGTLNSMNNWNYVYNLKDHTGSTRVYVATSTLGSTNNYCYPSAQIDYYPYGMERGNEGQTSSGPLNSGTNPYLYSGNESDRVNGLDMYDFKARWMDYATPAFTTVDPLTENTPFESPYAYCGGDPVNRVDPNGLAYYKYGNYVFWSDKNDAYVYHDGWRYENIGDYYIHEIDGKMAIEYKNNFLGFVEDFTTAKNEGLYDIYGFHPPTIGDNNNIGSGNEYGSYGEGDDLDKWRSNLVDGAENINEVVEAFGRATRDGRLLGVAKFSNPFINVMKMGLAIEKDKGIGKNTLTQAAKIGIGSAAGIGGVALGQYIGGFIGGGVGFFLGGFNAVPGVIIGQAVGGAIGGYFAASYSSDLVDAVAYKIK